MKKIYSFIILFFISYCATAQNTHSPDSTEKWNSHFQLTVIDQSHPSFKSPYSGTNSLTSDSEEALSLTTTLFIGRKLWKGAAVYFNPEVSGGSGISSARGIAGFSNGETFRIGNPSPALYLGRLFLRQYIALTKDEELVQSDNNQLKEYVPTKRIVITAGKFALSDLFDNNSYSHDPRSQFLNWSLMGNGAWDYPANTRGYTDGIVLEYITPSWEVRAAGTLVGTYANGPDFDYHFWDAYSSTVEFTKNISLNSHKGKVNLLLFRNVSKAPVYRDVINNYLNKTDVSLDVINGKDYGHAKYGIGINAEQELTKSLGAFFRSSWNDGKTATWAFTEIDRSISLGLNYTGASWHRPEDNFGIAGVINGISKDHRDFLNIGGYGFIIGDGQLSNYKTEDILEAYYSARLNKNLVVSGDYQFVQNPAYNADRGPVNVFSIRAHIEF
ncbi:carbohydrate porin [Mucilaginibacter paludis]|uniref:Carbohydrate-selective porin OprB n=1 Tax=Mucilaginibacter paludis DSM 18603 TaxID=714943 RepID=H1Y8Q5_9SPHI|nr:carbohydrate porin [Mucilaginibacter paludis]EHQ26927.1 Carbohydrate-selective porin OprB [Mucilaginibacter paludis DSM 18603]